MKRNEFGEALAADGSMGPTRLEAARDAQYDTCRVRGCLDEGVPGLDDYCWSHADVEAARELMAAIADDRSADADWGVA
ncbi:hypothetical protein [Nocardioides montaniterrae]